MNLRSVDLNLLTVFDAVMTEGNLTRAAEKIGMSQPAMSIAISRFRHIAKDELFERTGRGMRPTPRALALAGPVRRALDLVVDALQQGTEFDISRSERAFNVVLWDFGELSLLPALMQLLEAQNSDIRINTLSALAKDPKKEMHYGNVDLFLWLTPVETSDITCQQIGTTREVCLLRKDHPTVKNKLTLKQYAALKHVVFRMPGEYGASVIDRELWKHGLKRDHSITVHTYFDVPRVIAYSDMVCSIPQVMGRHFARVHDLKTVPAPIETVYPVFLMWPRGMENDQGHKWLRQTVMDIFTKEESGL
jgi:DNA-binding transcriptional LysR family regulator